MESLRPGDPSEIGGYRLLARLGTGGMGEVLGCTEALQLRQVRGSNAVFEAVTSHPTDPTAAIQCPRGNLYVLTLTDTDQLTLETEGSQSTGAPTALARQP
ncbi:hypothetical protein [Streptomyces virginiae]|uniref:Serine/threonine protein kinase n=1 Tax=Streptomyces virginiae TaxID=1961 RepID=A0ABZ1TQK5_STRVG|nr:hypothetical protein [Streptomyces virginiae]